MSLFIVIMGSVLILGGLHMLAPDHWVPLMVVARKLNYTSRKTVASALAMGSLHAITSETVAGIALIVGIFLVGNFLHYLDIASIILLVAVGIYFILNGYTEKNPENGYSTSSIRSILGISAFPDLALVPIMLASSPLPATSVLIVLVAFILVSSFSLAVMVYGAVKGFSRAMETVPPRYIDYVMGAVLFVTAAILAFVPI